VKPAYFGDSSCPLFGVHELSRAQTRREEAVLLCYPGAQEYNMAHWAFRRLSGLLAREGFHVMRFDWSGTGDSWGSTSDGTVSRWLDDISVAERELRDASGATSIALIGLRLGAALGALAGARGLNVDHLVLWEPVVEGWTYIEELEVLDASENTRLLHRVAPEGDEIAGYLFPRELRSAIARIDLCSAPPRTSKRITIVTGAERKDHCRYRDTLLRAGLNVVYELVPEDASATNAGQREAALLSNKSLTAIVNHVARRNAR
jgi:pimeloyl-ACP methyl ester carboxylesterase